jgi:hypothetical protein
VVAEVWVLIPPVLRLAVLQLQVKEMLEVQQLQAVTPDGQQAGAVALVAPVTSVIIGIQVMQSLLALLVGQVYIPQLVVAVCYTLLADKPITQAP